MPGRILRIDWSDPDLDRIREVLCDVDADTGCWLWRYQRNRQGYAIARAFGKKRRVNRLMLAAKLGRPLVGLALHSCHDPACVNPDHLREGDYKENAEDARHAGRLCCGERHHAAKLSRSNVLEIRKLRASGWKQAKIARRYGVTQAHVSSILRGITWKHV